MDKSTLKAVHKFVERAFDFQDEIEDVYYTFAECMKRGGGDCDDLALAKREVFLLMGRPDTHMDLIVGNLKKPRD